MVAPSARTALAVLLCMYACISSAETAVRVPFDTAPFNATPSSLPAIVFPRPAITDGAFVFPASVVGAPALPLPSSGTVRTAATNFSGISSASAIALPQTTSVATLAMSSSSRYFYRKGNTIIAYEVSITTLPGLTGVPNLVVLSPNQDVYIQAWKITIVQQVQVPGRAIALVANVIACDKPSAGCELDSSGEVAAALLPYRCWLHEHP